MTDINSQKIELNLGKYSGLKTFDNIEGLENWFTDEKSKFLNWTNSLQQRNGNVRLIYDNLTNSYNQISTAVSNAKQHANKEDFNNILKHSVENIEKIYIENKLLDSSSPRGKFILKIKETDELVAAFALGYFIGALVNNYTKSLEGAFVALQFDKGIESNINLEREALQDLRSKWESECNKLKESYNSINSDIEKLKTSWDSQIKSYADEFNKFKGKGEEELRNIGKTYDEKLSLQSSIRYWNQKLKSHKCLSKLFGAISLLSGVGIAWWLSRSVHELINNNNLENQSPEHWKLIVLAIFTSLGVWVVRILVRIFLSNLHLANDAQERITMITTYLAMLRSGHALNPEDKQLILQIVFRPSNSGLIKDEAAPPTIIDIFAKLSNGKKIS